MWSSAGKNLSYEAVIGIVTALHPAADGKRHVYIGHVTEQVCDSKPLQLQHQALPMHMEVN
jgi:hypothetical protein